MLKALLWFLINKPTKSDVGSYSSYGAHLPTYLCLIIHSAHFMVTLSDSTLTILSTAQEYLKFTDYIRVSPRWMVQKSMSLSLVGSRAANWQLSEQRTAHSLFFHHWS